MEWLWPILSVVAVAFKPENLAGTAIEGIIGNRIDSLVVGGCQATIRLFRQKDFLEQPFLKAAQKAYLLAQISLVHDCLQELEAKDSVLKYRGTEQYKQYPNEIRWLKRQSQDWKTQLKLLDTQEPTTDVPIDLTEIEALLAPQGQSAKEVTKAVKEKLLANISEDAAQIYKTRAVAEDSGLFERLGIIFAQELHKNNEVQQSFQTQILSEIHFSIADLKVLLDNLVQQDRQGNLAILQKLDQLIALLSQNPILVEVEQTALPDIGRHLPDNPFRPLNGRIDDPALFFPCEQLLSRIFELLNSGSSVALIGPPESGKSSLLRGIERNVDRLKLVRKPVYLDLSQVFGSDDFYTFLCDEAGIERCKGIQLNSKIKDQRLLLLLDEADMMSWEGFTNPVRRQLRGLANGGEAPLRLVVAARKPLDQLFDDSGQVSPFENICLQEEMTSWDIGFIRKFVQIRLEGTSLKFTEPELIKIVHESQGNPGKLMRICFELYREYQGRQ